MLRVDLRDEFQCDKFLMDVRVDVRRGAAFGGAGAGRRAGGRRCTCFGFGGGESSADDDSSLELTAMVLFRIKIRDEIRDYKF